MIELSAVEIPSYLRKLRAFHRNHQIREGKRGHVNPYALLWLAAADQRKYLEIIESELFRGQSMEE